MYLPFSRYQTLPPKQVSYKCTDFCDDELLFSGTARGGRTELSPDKAPSALMSVTVAEELGIFGVKPSKAMDMLTGKRVSLGLTIEAYHREVCALTLVEQALAGCVPQRCMCQKACPLLLVS